MIVHTVGGRGFINGCGHVGGRGCINGAWSRRWAWLHKWVREIFTRAMRAHNQTTPLLYSGYASGVCVCVCVLACVGACGLCVCVCVYTFLDSASTPLKGGLHAKMKFLVSYQVNLFKSSGNVSCAIRCIFASKIRKILSQKRTITMLPVAVK